MSLLLIWNIFISFSSVSIVDFDQVNDGCVMPAGELLTGILIISLTRTNILMSKFFLKLRSNIYITILVRFILPVNTFSSDKKTKPHLSSLLLLFQIKTKYFSKEVFKNWLTVSQKQALYEKSCFY